MKKRLSNALQIAFILFGVLALTGFAAVGPVHAQTFGKVSPPLADNTSFLTVEQAAAMGIKPGIPSQNGQIPTITAMPEGSVVPQSAHGCNKNVCITVTGKKLHVSLWQTTGYSRAAICTFAAYWANGRIIATSNEICARSATLYYSYLKNPGNFPNHTQLCNTWISISGKPCETVHS